MSALVHDLRVELLYQLTQTAHALYAPAGAHEAMILDEQYATICRFLDNPHLPKDEHE